MGRQTRDPPWTPCGILIKSLNFLGPEMHKVNDGQRWRSSVCPILCAMSFRERIIRIQRGVEGPTSLEDQELSSFLSRLLLTVCESLCEHGCPGVGSCGKAAVDTCSPLDSHFASVADLHVPCRVATLIAWTIPTRLEVLPRSGAQGTVGKLHPQLGPRFSFALHVTCCCLHMWLLRVPPTALPGGAAMSKGFSVWKNYDCLFLPFCKTAWKSREAPPRPAGGPQADCSL